jgi:uncharacterized protein YndB with AHSA1/START domain
LQAVGFTVGSAENQAGGAQVEDIRDEIVVTAPASEVWKAIKDPATHAQWHPAVTRIEGQHELGAVRKCDVMIGRKPGSTEELCTAYDEGRTIMWTIQKDSTGFSRMVSDWSAGFALEPQAPDSTLVMARSVFKPSTLPARLMLPLIRRKFHQTQLGILTGLKHYVEG